MTDQEWAVLILAGLREARGIDWVSTLLAGILAYRADPALYNALLSGLGSEELSAIQAVTDQAVATLRTSFDSLSPSEAVER